MTSIKFQVRLAALLMIVALATTLAIAQTPAPAPSLDTLVRAEIAPFKGKVYLFAKNLDTGQTYSFNGDDRVRTASTMKSSGHSRSAQKAMYGKGRIFQSSASRSRPYSAATPSSLLRSPTTSFLNI